MLFRNTFLFSFIPAPYFLASLVFHITFFLLIAFYPSQEKAFEKVSRIQVKFSQSYRVEGIRQKAVKKLSSFNRKVGDTSTISSSSPFATPKSSVSPLFTTKAVKTKTNRKKKNQFKKASSLKGFEKPLVTTKQVDVKGFQPEKFIEGKTKTNKVENFVDGKEEKQEWQEILQADSDQQSDGNQEGQEEDEEQRKVLAEVQRKKQALFGFDASELEQYRSLIAEVVQSKWFAPKTFIAKLKVDFQITLSAQGKLIRMKKVSSSGNKGFDVLAKQALLSVESYPSFPESFPQDEVFTVILRFSPQRVIF